MDSEIARLASLVGSDPGFYVLAVHSFVEHFLRDVLTISDAEGIAELLSNYQTTLHDETSVGRIKGLVCLKDLARQHKFTHTVLHSFIELDEEEAVAATYLFVVFTGLAGLGSISRILDFDHQLHTWDNRESVGDMNAPLAVMQRQLQAVQARNGRMLGNLARLEESDRELAGLEHEIHRFTLEIDELRGRRAPTAARVDALCHERTRLRDMRRDLKAQNESQSELRRYISNLGRFSIYTKIRMDYERTNIRLTQDQADAVTAIDRTGHFLIRGSAGTGKSLVLVEALKRALEVGELDFAGEPDRRAMLLTFTRTLAKFEDYVTSILEIENVRKLVQTVDAFFLSRLRRIDDRFGFEFGAVDRLAAEHNTTGFFSNAELGTEIEDYLLGNFVTREEYVDEVVDRVGLRRRLSRRQRETVWEIREAIVTAMDEAGKYSRNYARIKILEYLASASQDEASRLRDVRTIYLDEAQDLTAGDLLTLKSLVTGHLIMAADSDQTIYGVSSPYARAGISISGRTRVLKTNFRNTRQIHELSRRFRPTEDDGEAVTAFREGPPPELYVSDSPDKLTVLLLTKLDLFLNHLEYDPENISILSPSNAEVNQLAAILDDRSIPAEVITTREFQFTDAGTIRLSTLHSSKGLDFPVVLMYLPHLQRHAQYDREATEILLRNLIHVGVTRAMENLNLFVCPGDDPLLYELMAAFVGSETE